MATWATWLPDVLPKVPGCPVPIAEHELRRAAQSLYEQTRIWRLSLVAIAVTAGDTEKALVVDSGNPVEKALVRVEHAWYDGTPLDVYLVDEMDGNFSDDWEGHTGTPKALIQQAPGVVRLYPIPEVNATLGLKVRVSVKPADTSTGIADQFLAKYREVIAAGALARLLLYPKKPWTDVQLAAVYATAFNAESERAGYQAATGFGNGRISSQPRWC